MWNTYTAPLAPYPAHLGLPDDIMQHTLLLELATAMRLSSTWCPMYVLTGLGVYLGARGAPRCPVVAAKAIGALAWCRRGVWEGVPALADTARAAR